MATESFSHKTCTLGHDFCVVETRCIYMYTNKPKLIVVSMQSTFPQITTVQFKELPLAFPKIQFVSSINTQMQWLSYTAILRSFLITDYCLRCLLQCFWFCQSSSVLYFRLNTPNSVEVLTWKLKNKWSCLPETSQSRLHVFLNENGK